jgi:hypothetical protein
VAPLEAATEASADRVLERAVRAARPASEEAEVAAEAEVVAADGVAGSCA